MELIKLLWSYFRKYELVNFAHAKVLFYLLTSVLPQNIMTFHKLRKIKKWLVVLGRNIWQYVTHISEYWNKKCYKNLHIWRFILSICIFYIKIKFLVEKTNSRAVSLAQNIHASGKSWNWTHMLFSHF